MREPKYCHHKPTDQAYVRFTGKTIYLGRFGSAESKERYGFPNLKYIVCSQDLRNTKLELNFRWSFNGRRDMQAECRRIDIFQPKRFDDGS